MQFGDLIEYNMRNFFTKKSYTKCGRKASPRPTKTKTMSVLIPLSQVGGFLSIICIPSWAMSIQILLYALLPWFPWSMLLPFPSYFNFHNLMYLGIDVSTYDMTIPSETPLNYCILYLQSKTHSIRKNLSQHPINQSHPTHHPDHTTFHPMQPRFIRDSKFPDFTTVQQNWSNKTLINLPLLLQR